MELNAVLSIHNTGKEEHGDLFIDVPGRIRLLTYHIEPYLLSRVQDHANNKWYIRTEAEPGNSVQLVRKEDHRKIYLNYEGEISENRGTIRIALKKTVQIDNIMVDREKAFLVWTEDFNPIDW